MELKGDQILEHHIEFRRPGFGISPAFWYHEHAQASNVFIAKNDLPSGHIVSHSDVTIIQGGNE